MSGEFGDGEKFRNLSDKIHAEIIDLQHWVQPLEALGLTPRTALVDLSSADCVALSAACKVAMKLYNNHINTCN